MEAAVRSASVMYAARQVALTVAVVLGLAGAAVYLPGPIVDRMMRSDLQVQAATWRERIVAHLTHAERTFNLMTITHKDSEFLSGVVQASDIFRLQLINADGLVFWASIAEEMGTFHDSSDHGHALASGEVLVTINSARAREYVAAPGGDAMRADLARAKGLLDSTTTVAEIDAPIDLKDGGGRVEMFVDLTTKRDAFVARVRAIIVGVAVVAGLAGTLLIISVMQGNRRRVREIRLRSDAEKSALADQLRMAREVRLLGELNEWLQSARSLTELFEMVARFLTHMLPHCEGSFYVYSNSRDVLDGCASWNGGQHKAHIHPDECWALRRGRTHAYGDNEVEFACGHTEPHDGRGYLCIPVLAHGETIGLMHLRAHDGGTVEEFRESRRLAQMCAEQISLAIANVRMRDQLQDQSVRDPLTGLFNRRHLTDSLRRALTARKRTGEDLALVAIDVDHFKRFNDNHGHDAGDMVLRAVGAALVQQCDRDEVACRIGGEELMVLLPATDAAAAMARAETMRTAVEAISVRYGEKTLPRVTISLGVAVASKHGKLPQDLMRAADEALYHAKGLGRNQTVLADFVAQGEPEAPPVPRIAAE